jgi:dTDP-4-dehydrorhamnose reductase
MKRIILLTGKSGQVGSHLHRLLLQLGEVIAPDRHQLDLLNPDDIRRVVREVRPELIVNAAAYTAVDAAETDEANALAINATAPALLAEEANRLCAALVHYSTDYVFDGSKTEPYDEADPPNPLNVYGSTKLAGEEAVRRSGVPHLIFRTSWVYETSGRNFLLTILRLATERKELKIVCDQIGSPTRASRIAAATHKILTRVCQQSGGNFRSPEIPGTYHMTAAGQTTWYDFAKVILEHASSAPADTSWFAAATKGRPLVAQRVLPITSDEYRSAVRRPAYSVLSNSRLNRTFHFALPLWSNELQQCFEMESIGGRSATAESIPNS